VRALKVLIALQLTLIVVAGVLTAVRLPFFSPIDEAAHFDYVRIVAEDGRLPVLDEDEMGLSVVALGEGLDPDARPAPEVERSAGLGGKSYQAFEPPLYYVLAAPAFALTGDWSQRVKLVRLLGLGFLLGAVAFVFGLARRALPDAHLIAFSVALTVLMWPGVIVRMVTVSNASLELLLGCALLYALWRADEDLDRRWLLLAGALMGLGLLTKLTLVALAPLLVAVALRHAWRGGRRDAWAVAAVSVALPLVLLAPWAIFNLDHYDAVTPSALAKEMQEPTVNPTGISYTVGRFLDRLPRTFEGLLPQDWAPVREQAPPMAFAFEFLKIALFGLPVLLALVDPRRLWGRHAALLLAPWLLGLAMVAYVTLTEDWPIGSPRRLYPELPALALFTAASCLWLFRSSRAAVALAVASSLVLAAAWVDLTSRFLL
jgi:4-amino-4-deoxy-L-arabinose transferase-like glycosyltransferase